MEFCGEKQCMCDSCIDGKCTAEKCLVVLGPPTLSDVKRAEEQVEKYKEEQIKKYEMPSPSPEESKSEWPKPLCPGAENILVNEDEAKDITELMNRAFEEVRKSNSSEAFDKLSGKKSDEGKLRFSLLPWDALEKVVEVLEYGAKKYSDYGWKDVDNGYYCFIDAAFRHIKSIMENFDYDDESNLLHIAHAATNLLFALHFKCK